MNAYLFVCSVNKLRSPTAEHVARSMGYSADSAGSVPSWDPIRPLTVEAIDRAESIVCMEQRHADAVIDLRPEAAARIQVWNIPDDFDYCDPELIKMIRARLPARTYEPMRSSVSVETKETATAQTRILYSPCAKHVGTPWTMAIGWSPPPKTVCPICEPPIMSLIV